MKKLLMLTLLFVVIQACGQSNIKDELFRPEYPSTKKDTVLFVDFNSSAKGIYTDEGLRKDFGEVNWSLLFDRGEIISDAERGNVLKVLFPKGSVGPQKGGIQFSRPLPPANSYYFDCYIRFSEDFDFNLGGKLPGLTSGGDKYTGGKKPVAGDGWSARYMWTDKLPVIYLYYVDMPGKYGESIPLKQGFEKGKWYRLTQYVKINSEDRTDAEIKVWIDGKQVLNMHDFRLRCGNLGLIDTFYFSTFHGGNTHEWAPSNDCSITFDNILIKRFPVDFSK